MSNPPNELAFSADREKQIKITFSTVLFWCAFISLPVLYGIVYEKSLRNAFADKTWFEITGFTAYFCFIYFMIASDRAFHFSALIKSLVVAYVGMKYVIFLALCIKYPFIFVESELGLSTEYDELVIFAIFIPVLFFTNLYFLRKISEAPGSTERY
ncbi:MAG: hypothetical protein SGI88_20435 [Candidatus Hydrogenedentes bacterium]|nr:hypothetical protein [Candidatus Hydrogenedentota bacterium]